MEIRKTTDNEDFSFFSSSCNLHIFQSLYLPLIHSFSFFDVQIFSFRPSFYDPFSPPNCAKIPNSPIMVSFDEIVRCFVRCTEKSHCFGLTKCTGTERFPTISAIILSRAKQQVRLMVGAIIQSRLYKNRL